MKRLKIAPEDPDILVDVFTLFDQSRECKLSLSDLQAMLLPIYSSKGKVLQEKENLENRVLQKEVDSAESLILHKTRTVFEKIIELVEALNQTKLEIRSQSLNLD